MDVLDYCVLTESVDFCPDDLADETYLPIVDELYIFHAGNPTCPTDETLWGFISEIDARGVLLEHGSTDLRNFRIWYALPTKYRYCRLATRAELRDYMFALGLFCGRSFYK